MTPEQLAALDAAALAARLGGPLAAPEAAPAELPQPPELVEAAVLVPLLDGAAGDGPSLLFLRRSRDLPDHAGQVAFPGGVREARDASLRATALREACEEVAVAVGEIRVMGPLPRVSTLAKYSIQPYLSLWPPGPHGVASPAEVARVFQVPVAWLADPTHSEETEIALPGRRLRVPAWLWDGEVIWGATRRITLTLLELIARTSSR